MSLMNSNHAAAQVPVDSAKMAFKALIIGALTLVILIALWMISSVVDDRAHYRAEAGETIAKSYAGAQTLLGPILVRPYTVKTRTKETNAQGAVLIVEGKRAGMAWSFPHELTVKGTMVPSEKRRGPYRIPVYEFNSHVGGVVDVTDAVLEDGEDVKDVVYGEPYFALSVSDVRGIVGTPAFTVDGAGIGMYQLVGQVGSWTPNLQAPLKIAGGNGSLHGRLEFALDLNLAGTEHLNIAPVGDSTHIEVSSAWPTPLFDGRFLPRSPSIGKDGFKASWDVSSLALGGARPVGKEGKNEDAIGINMVTPIDLYTLSNRAVKYGILFVMITFGGFFLFESVKRMRIHPVQYFLVGLGLAIFFLLLISLSEHIDFGWAYLAASAACIGLLTFYLTFVLRNVGYGMGFGAMLTALYAGIYGLLVSEDNALVLGSLMLFALLALAMYVTRKVDWYGEAALAE